MKNKVIVVGAGPGGCSTAITIKKLLPELEVELFEQRPKIGKRECGEAISHRAVEENRDILQNVFRKCIARDVNEFIIKVGEVEDHTNVHGHMIHRQILNKGLVKEAQLVGCKIRTGRRVTVIQRKNDAWKVNIENRFSHKSHSDECDVLVLAGGGSSRMAVDTGLITEGEHRKWVRGHVFGYQYKIKAPSYGEEALLIDFTPNPSPDIVYHYAFPHHEDVGNFGLLNRHKFVARTFYTKLLREYLRKLGIERYKHIGNPSGNYIPGNGPIPKTYGDGVIAVGDNAGFANPIFYAGIYTAISSGRIAGKVISTAYEIGNFEEATLSEYEKEWRNMPWGSPILLEGKIIHEKLRANEPITTEEREIYAKALAITKNYGW